MDAPSGDGTDFIEMVGFNAVSARAAVRKMIECRLFVANHKTQRKRHGVSRESVPTS